jgi:hypothetical protein
MKNIFILLMLSCSLAASAQDSLKMFNTDRSQITATGMTVLGSWGVANLGVGIAGWANSNGGQNKYFYQMTAIWGGINFALAIPGLINAEHSKSEVLTPAASLKEQERLEKIFMVNGGLDLVYIGAGTFLNHRGLSNGNAQLRGYGTSIIAQGAFLLLFDATMFTSEKNNGNKLRRFLEKHPIGFTGKGIGMSMHI